MTHDLVVFGDINLDTCVESRLSFQFADMMEPAHNESREVLELPGGTGLNFARWARQEGFAPLIVGRVGDDYAGAQLLERLRDFQVEAAVTKDREAGTGRAVVIRDSADVRLLVDNTPNANHRLSVEDVRACEEQIQAAKVIYVSGYCLCRIESPRRAAMEHLSDLLVARRAQGRSPFVVVDTVPGTDEHVDFETYRHMTRAADLVVAKVSTMRRFLKLGTHTEFIDWDKARETYSVLRPFFPRALLRFGPAGCDNELICDGERPPVEAQRVLTLSTDKRGVAERLTLRCLREHFAERCQLAR